jgi:phosphoribosylformylglycinamidine synthase
MPWASKATDIAHNCGLDVAYRERITEYRLSLNWLFSKSALTESQHDQVAALLHDRMTESVADRAHAEDLFTEPAGALQTIDAIAGRKPRCSRPTASSAWHRLKTRLAIWSRPLPSCSANPTDVELMMFAGQQRALPAQDFQRRLHD